MYKHDTSQPGTRPNIEENRDKEFAPCGGPEKEMAEELPKSFLLPFGANKYCYALGLSFGPSSIGTTLTDGPEGSSPFSAAR